MHEYNLLHKTVCLLIKSSHLIFVINNTFALPLSNTHFDACTIHCSWQSLIPTDIGIQCHRKPSLELSQSSKGGMCTKSMHTYRHNLFTYYHCCLQTTNSLNSGLHPNTFSMHTHTTHYRWQTNIPATETLLVFTVIVYQFLCSSKL